MQSKPRWFAIWKPKSRDKNISLRQFVVGNNNNHTLVGRSMETLEIDRQVFKTELFINYPSLHIPFSPCKLDQGHYYIGIYISCSISDCDFYYVRSGPKKWAS